MKWNANLYEKYGMERLQPTLDLINRIPDGSYKRIIDIGCGSGMSTLPLKQRFSEAEIFGVDSSAEMLAKAAETSDGIQWKQRDCSQSLEDMGKFDLVFSNAFLQWLQNQEEFLSRIPKMLLSGGVFALQVPNYDNMPIKKCVDRVVLEFGNRFAEIEKTMCHNATLTEYYDILCRYFADVTIWQTNYAHVMDSYEAIVQFISATGLRPYLEVMSESEQIEMKDKLVTTLKEVYPRQENGKILFPFERIEFIAR